MRYVVFLAALLFVTAIGIADSRSARAVDIIPAGQDLYETNGPASYMPPPLPGGFFYPGSDPFFGTIQFTGQPLGPATGTADTIIQRMGQADLFPPYPVQDIVPIEIVALELKSVAPITVTGPGGPQAWDVFLDLAPGGPSPGQMQITKTDSDSGTYQIQNVQIRGRYTFVRQSDSLTQVLAPVFINVNGDSGKEWFEVCGWQPYYITATSFCRLTTEPPSPVRTYTTLTGSSTVHRLWPACTDGDLDGVADCVDNCPADANAGQEDADADGLGDACDPTPNGDIPPGHILLQSRLEDHPYQDWVYDIPPSDPIPAGFFDPGSDPFLGDIGYAGSPLPGLGMTDTVIERLGPANLPPPYPSTDEVPIEMVALSLVSTQPITVTYGGLTPELWDVKLEVSPLQQSLGALDMTADDAGGGTVDGTFTVIPRFTFTRQSDAAVRVLDGYIDTRQFEIDVESWSWSTTCPPEAVVVGESHPYYPSDEMCSLDNDTGAIDFVRWGALDVPSDSDLHILVQACEDLDTDLAGDCYDNCPGLANVGQADTDGDGAGDACDLTPNGDVPPGHILLDTEPPANVPDYVTYGIPPTNPVPAGFFDPGSEPFDGLLQLNGDPLNPGSWGLTDTIIERLEPANLPAPYPSTDQVPIELVALNLVSVQPITVTYPSAPDELWDVRLEVSPTTPSTGTLDITATSANGGSFDGGLTIYPKFTFTRQSDSAMRVLDLPSFNLDVVMINSILWSNVCDPNTVTVPFPQQYYTTDDFCFTWDDDGVVIFSVDPPVDHTLQQACYDVDTDVASDCNDNCLGLSNPAQTDTDGDGAGDACDPTPNGDVPVGAFHLETVDPATYDPGPIPADFFNPGSEPFDAWPWWSGVPLEPLTLGTTDTIIERLEAANLPPPYPSQDTVPIEMVALSLKSVAPITVEYTSGPDELWDVEISLDAPSLGTMTFERTGPGSDYITDVDLPSVNVEVTFLRQSDSFERTLFVNLQVPYSGQLAMAPSFPNATGDAPYLAAMSVLDSTDQSLQQACVDPDLDDVGNCGRDNCPTVANTNQANGDGDATGDACEAAHCTNVPNWWTSPGPSSDPDCDFFDNAAEIRLGTDPNDSCADTGTAGDEPDDKFPADFNDSRVVNTLDLTGYASRLGTIPSTALDHRHDLNGNNLINTLDLVIFATALNRQCGP